MKLASLRQGGRDGSLIVVNQDLTRAVACPQIAATLQQALDNWSRVAPPLQSLYQRLCADDALTESFPFDPQQTSSPLPRAYQFLDGSAYVNHVELVRRSRGVEMPQSFWTDPLMYQGLSDSFLAPHEVMPFINPDEDWGADFEGEIAIITDDVPMGVSLSDAEQHICLVLLCNDISLRLLAAQELQKGFGFVQCKPASSFSPVAVTLEELGRHWREGRLQLPLRCSLNGELFGEPHAGTDMVFNFPQLIVHAAKTRRLAAGTIIGSGTVSNRDRGVGSSCIVERRTLETLEQGRPGTPFLRAGDRVRLEVLDDSGHSIFGAIEQEAVLYRRASGASLQ
jgi:fumarylacetoacetate (FAA) hydrolase